MFKLPGDIKGRRDGPPRGSDAGAPGAGCAGLIGRRGALYALDREQAGRLPLPASDPAGDDMVNQKHVWPAKAEAG